MPIEYFQPTFLYESLLNFLLFLFLFFVIKKFGAKYEGLTFSLYIALYAVIRFFIEGLRLDSAMNIGDLHIAQIVSVVSFIIALVMFFVVVFKQRAYN